MTDDFKPKAKTFQKEATLGKRAKIERIPHLPVGHPLPFSELYVITRGF